MPTVYCDPRLDHWPESNQALQLAAHRERAMRDDGPAPVVALDSIRRARQRIEDQQRDYATAYARRRAPSDEPPKAA